MQFWALELEASCPLPLCHRLPGSLSSPASLRGTVGPLLISGPSLASLRTPWSCPPGQWVRRAEQVLCASDPSGGCIFLAMRDENCIPAPRVNHCTSTYLGTAPRLIPVCTVASPTFSPTGLHISQDLCNGIHIFGDCSV